MEIRIQSVRFTADQKLIDYINEKLNKLVKYNDRIINLDVYLKLENSGQVKDKVVELRGFSPGNTFFANAVQKSFEAAFDKALLSFKRQVKKQNDILKNPRYSTEN